MWKHRSENSFHENIRIGTNPFYHMANKHWKVGELNRGIWDFKVSDEWVIPTVPSLAVLQYTIMLVVMVLELLHQRPSQK